MRDAVLEQGRFEPRFHRHKWNSAQSKRVVRLRAYNVHVLRLAKEPSPSGKRPGLSGNKGRSTSVVSTGALFNTSVLLEVSRAISSCQTDRAFNRPVIIQAGRARLLREPSRTVQRRRLDVSIQDEKDAVNGDGSNSTRVPWRLETSTSESRSQLSRQWYQTSLSISLDERSLSFTTDF